MARITCNSTIAVLTVEIRFIYLHRHLYHFTRHELHWLIVLFAVDLLGYSDVTVNALQAERIGHEMYFGIQLVGGQILRDLDVFELF